MADFKHRKNCRSDLKFLSGYLRLPDDCTMCINSYMLTNNSKAVEHIINWWFFCHKKTLNSSSTTTE